MENMNKIIEKINNLFDLSRNNPSESEAMAAALKAQELMAKYHISMTELETEEDADQVTIVTVNVFDHKNGAGTIKWRYNLATAVANNFRCDVCFSKQGHVYFFGYKTDAEIAARTFTFLFQTGNRYSANLYNKVRRMGGNTKGVRSAYQIGFVKGVRESLEVQSHDLMIVTPEAVHKYFDSMTEQSTVKHGVDRAESTEECYDAYDTGRTDGRSVVDGTRLEDRAG